MSGETRLGRICRNMIRRCARPERPAGLHELALAQREHVAAHEPGDIGPREERDDQDHQGQPGLDGPVEAALLAGRARGDDADREEQQRDRQDDVGHARDQRVDPAAVVAGQHAEHHAHEHRDAGRDDAHDQGHADPVDRADEDVAPAVVGAEPEGAGRPLRDAEDVRRLPLEQLVGSVPRDRRDRRARRSRRDQEQDERQARRARIGPA